MSVAGMIRFAFGAALLAAGGTLVAPLATSLAAAARTTAPSPQPAVSPQPPVPHGPNPVGVPLGAAPAPALPQVDVGPPPPVEPWGDATGVDGGFQLDRCPPPPPAPLPPSPRELALANPALGAAYRSTLHVPPPPLLDAESPPPTAAWATAPTPSASPVPAAPPLPVAAVGELTVPSTYRIQDGDDLGTIAGRFYGQPAAASAIWAANRETIPNPDLLPIGAELRLPPPWAVGGQRRPVAGAIEPAAYARPTAPLIPGTTASRAAVPWLAPADAASAPLVPPHPPASAVAATSVRVGPGETLGALARRLYGDPAMAEAIFAVNRDRLRGPDLVVPGMDLRLPRPITAPRP